MNQDPLRLAGATGQAPVPRREAQGSREVPRSTEEPKTDRSRAGRGNEGRQGR